MTLFILVAYFILGFLLFIGINYFKKFYRFTRLDSVLFSLIYLVIVGGVFINKSNSFNDNLFLIFVFYFICDIVYTTYFLERDFFDQSEENFAYYLILILGGFVLNQSFFNEVVEIFPTGEDLRLIIWLFIFIYLYKFIKKYDVFKDSDFSDMRRFDDEKVIVSYAKLKHQFFDDLDFKNRELELAVFAIMIYENYKCPAFFRRINNIKFKLDGKTRKLGIMQIESKKFISDLESIEIVYKKIEKLFSTKSIKNIYDVINKYTKDNSESVIEIYNILDKFTKK